jgi:hypothetical protein
MLEQPILKQLILAAYSFKELAITFFPPGNRSKPGEIHIFPRHGIKGKREPRAGNEFPSSGNLLLYNTYETTKANSTSFPGAARPRENTGLFICTGKELSPSSLLFQWQQLV